MSIHFVLLILLPGSTWSTCLYTSLRLSSLLLCRVWEQLFTNHDSLCSVPKLIKPLCTLISYLCPCLHPCTVTLGYEEVLARIWFIVSLMFQRLNNMFVGEINDYPSQEPEFSEKEEEEWILVDFIGKITAHM